MKHYMRGLNVLLVLVVTVATVTVADGSNGRTRERNRKSGKMAALKGSFASASPIRCRLEGRMQGSATHPLASGKGKFEKRDDRLRTSVEVEDLAAQFIGTNASVNVGGEDLGTIEVVCINPLATPPCTLGGFDLNLDSRDGDSVTDLVGTDDCGSASVMFSVTDFNGDMIGSGTMIEKSNAGNPGDPNPGDEDECRLEGRLDSGTNHPLASGNGKFEKRNARLRISVEIEDVAASFIGTIATVTVGGEDIGMVEILCINPLATPPCTLGGFDLNLDTFDGDAITDLVGMQACGDVSTAVTVTDADGNVIVSGTIMKK